MKESDATGSLAGRMSRRFAAAALACSAVLLTSLGAVHASYFNPTHVNDCNMYQYNIGSALKDARDRAHQCFRRLTANEIIRAEARKQKVRTSCSGLEHPKCAPLYEQSCQIKAQMDSLRQSCMAKLQVYKQEEARRRAEEEAVRLAAEQAQRETNRFNMQSGQLAATGDVRGEIKAQGSMITYVRRGGKLFAKRIGIPTDQMGGAYHLSEAVSDVALRYLQGTGENSLRALEDAMKQAAFLEANAQGLVLNDQILQMRDSAAQAASSGPYSRDNPMPTQAESDRMREEIMNRTVEAALLEGDLPFGGESAVAGENAQHLTAIAQARAEGRLDTPLHQIDVSEAAAYAGSDDHSNIALDENRMPRQGSAALYEQRTAALGDIRTSINERRQREQVERETAQKPRVTSKGTEQQRRGRRVGNCVQMTSDNSFHSILRNRCSYAVSAYCTNYGGRPERVVARPLHEGANTGIFCQGPIKDIRRH